MFSRKYLNIIAVFLLMGGVVFPLTANADESEFTIVSSEVDSDEKTTFEIVKRTEVKEIDLSRKIITDDPNFEIVRTRPLIKKNTGNKNPAMEEYEKAEEAYRAYIREKERPRRFLLFSYVPLHNTINGIDARLFITGVLVSVFYVLVMLLIWIYELGHRPPLYSVEQMISLRAQGYGQIPESDANLLADNLWSRAVGGKKMKDDDVIDLDSRQEVYSLHTELSVAAASLPTDPESVRKLNRISDSVHFWRSRYLVAPFINSDSGIFKRIIMVIVYLTLVFYVYPYHPMFLLVIFCPLAFFTPAYLVADRENSKVYRMLGGSLKLFGKMTGSALNTVATGEGSTVTVYTNSWGNVKAVEHNYWGTVILFVIKAAIALFFLYLVFTLAPLIVLYALIRNYILSK